jgi:hypothetical protein
MTKRDISSDFFTRKNEKVSSVILMPTGDVYISYKLPKKKKKNQREEGNASQED